MNISSFLKHSIAKETSEKFEKLMVIRHDGICVFSNTIDTFESATIGALVSGLWQAAESLAALGRKQSSYDEFRLAFDRTDEGLYVLPLRLKESVYFICALFNKIDNPAKAKRNLRVLKLKLESEVLDIQFSAQSNREGYLFKNITDEEMDKIFRVGGA